MRVLLCEYLADASAKSGHLQPSRRRRRLRERLFEPTRTCPGADSLAAAGEVERLPHSELWQMVVFLRVDDIALGLPAALNCIVWQTLPVLSAMNEIQTPSHLLNVDGCCLRQKLVEVTAIVCDLPVILQQHRQKGYVLVHTQVPVVYVSVRRAWRQLSNRIHMIPIP